MTTQTTTWYNETIRLIKEDRMYRLKNEWPLLKLNEVIMNTYVPDNTMFHLVPEFHIPLFLSPKIQLPEIIHDIFSLPDAKECLVLAGGFLYEKFLDNYRTLIKIKPIDYDFFFYKNSKLSDKESTDQCIRCLNTIKIFLYLKYKKCNASRNKYVINIKPEEQNEPEQMFQFITKVFPNKSSIIGQFDVTSSSILYDGTNFLVTPLAAFSYRSKYNYIDTTRASSTYETRLVKYCKGKKGFGIAFPEYDMKKVNVMYEKSGYNLLMCYMKNDTIYANYTEYGVDLFNVPQMLKLFKEGKFPKIYIKCDLLTSEYKTEELEKDIREFYFNKIPTIYKGNINKLRKYYDEDVYKKLLVLSFNINDREQLQIKEMQVSKKYVDILIEQITTYIKGHEINWNIDENPLGPKPVQAEIWYGSIYKPMEIEPMEIDC